jgi:hypothetical protein
MNNASKGKVRTVLAVSVVIILACVLAYHITRYQQNLDRLLRQEPNQVSDFENYLDNCDYPYVLEMAKENEIIDEKPYESVDQYISFAYFYEAMTYYHLYLGSDKAKANEYKQKAETYLSQITSNHFNKHIKNVEEFYASEMIDDSTD